MGEEDQASGAPLGEHFFKRHECRIALSVRTLALRLTGSSACTAAPQGVEGLRIDIRHLCVERLAKGAR